MKMLIGVVLITLVLLFCLLVYICFRLACVRGKHTAYNLVAIPEDHYLYPYRTELLKAYNDLKELKSEPLSITTFDDLTLYGEYFEAKGSRKTIILMHGFRSAYSHDFCISVHFYLSLGFNVLLAEQRAHGKSEGRYITYGANEKYDCRDWVMKLLEAKGEDMQIVLAGLSMGASTVLLCSALDLPKNVKAVVADCGYTSAYDMIKATMKAVNRHIPSFLVDLTNFLCRILADFDLNDANTLPAMQNAHIPILFIHGTRDSTVPCEMTLRNYATCKAPKELLTIAGAEHGIAFLVGREKYEQTLKDFFSKHLDQD